jgi:hypothetical protein
MVKTQSLRVDRLANGPFKLMSTPVHAQKQTVSIGLLIILSPSSESLFEAKYRTEDHNRSHKILMQRLPVSWHLRTMSSSVV